MTNKHLPERNDEKVSLDKEISNIIENTVGNSPNGKIAQEQIINVLHKRTQFSGPLPPPGLLQAYEEINPGSAERILKMADEDLNHQHNFHYRLLIEDSKDALLGRISGIFALILIIGASVFCGMNGLKELSLALVGTSAIGVISAFIIGNRNNTGSNSQS
ncbi:DUF2335 domain-containing protein [Woodsholea maritima]|uniref:DUF2335 domain-containing protein n=1 Tax=Woodsholea maritima TaxID=240237 RepID=UPI000A00DB77|nr:DUF2335 domain-containing protein [Woodsholea maritima]